MKRDEMKKVMQDWRVIVMVVAIVLALASIYLIPPAFDKGVQGNIQLGLILKEDHGFSWSIRHSW